MLAAKRPSRMRDLLTANLRSVRGRSLLDSHADSGRLHAEPPAPKEEANHGSDPSRGIQYYDVRRKHLGASSERPV